MRESYRGGYGVKLEAAVAPAGFYVEKQIVLTKNNDDICPYALVLFQQLIFYYLFIKVSFQCGGSLEKR